MEEENLDSKNISNEASASEKLSGNASFEKLHIRDSVRREQLELQDPYLGNKVKLDVHDLQKFNVLSGSNTVSTQSCMHIRDSVRREQLELQDPYLGNKMKLDVHDLQKFNDLSGSNTVSTQSSLHIRDSLRREQLELQDPYLGNKVKLDVNDLQKINGLSGSSTVSSQSCLDIRDYVTRGQLELQDSYLGKKVKLNVNDFQKINVLSGSSTVSTQSCLHRSNWDLNMTMDAWEESPSESEMTNRECDGNSGPGFSSLLGRNLMSAGLTREESDASPPKFGEPKSLSNDTFPSLHTSPKSGHGVYNSETEAYLDLFLKPSFLPESHFSYENLFNLGKVDSLKFLSLSMNSSSSTPETTATTVCGAVKSEPHGSIQERKTETFVLKPVKSESCEIGEASRIRDSLLVNSASAAAIKQEPIEDLDQSQDHSMAKETRVSHLHSYDHNLLKSAKFMDSNTKHDSHMKDGILPMPRECHEPLKCEVDNMVQVMKDADEGREFTSIKHASNEGSEHADFFIKSPSEEGQNMNLQSGSWEDDKTANLQEESSTSGTLAENVADEKSEVVSPLSLSETDSKTELGAETYLNADVIECSQTDKELSFPLEEECDNECDPGSSHAIDGVIGAVFEKGGVDSRGFEDGELRDEASLRANVGSHLMDEIEKSEDVCSRELVDVSVDLSSSHENGKHLAVESPEMSKDPGTVECVNNVDPSVAADLQESSSVTGDSCRREMSRATRKISRDSSRKDKMSERKTKFDRDPAIVNIDKKDDGNGGAAENSGGHIESSFPLSSESKRDAFTGGRSGRIINLNSSLSRSMNRIHESPLSSRIEREKSADKSFKRQKYSFGRSRDEDVSERYHKTGNEKKRGLACGNSGSGSVHTRTRGGSNLPHSRVRDERQPNLFGGRNFDMNYTRDQIHKHNDFQYSRPIPPAEVTMNSMSDASIPHRISRKVSNHTSEVHSELGYASQPKSRRTMPDKMLDQTHSHEQFNRTDRIPPHRERLSLSPRSRGMSPSHWSPHTAPDGFNGQADMVQCRSGAPIVMHESMRSTRQQRLTEEMFGRRRGSGHGSRSHKDMMEVGSSREHDFPRRDFSRKIYPRQVTDEYYGSSFARGQIHELSMDRESAVRRRYSEARNPVRCRQRCMDNDEDFSFHIEERPPGSYGYHTEGDRGFKGGGCSSEIGGRFKNRLGNTSRRYRDMEEGQEQHEDGFRHQAELGWNDSGFNNDRPRSNRY
ncbi:hypothetical protein KSP40_PGU007384 [Platanthera guangdongensis]|uniref:Uncharacterized protein n=1 Tax=Platanthera guangdongensis TaxID=2320717 RepID=A0ABR2MYB6_9ASPA